MDNINGQIIDRIVVNGREIKCMEKVFLNGLMEGTLII